MDLHILEVVHQVIKSVVYGVYGAVEGPFTGVLDEGVKVYLEVHYADF